MGATSAIRIARAAALGVATLIGSCLSSPPARAAYTVTFEQEGSSVVASGMGTIDLDALSIFQNASATASVTPAEGILDTGPTSLTLVDEYQGGAITGPTSFGSGGFIAANSGSGDMVGISDGSVFGEPIVTVPSGYVSGTALSDMSTYDNTTLNMLGATPGTYVWTWGSGASEDSFTLDIVAPISAPEPGSLPLVVMGLAGLGVVLRTRRA
jgi:hypothetical protein